MVLASKIQVLALRAALTIFTSIILKVMQGNKSILAIILARIIN